MKMNNVWAVIPARGGSKGLPRKNIRSLAGKPLLAYSIDSALACRQVSRVIVSTDDPEIAGVARACGAEVPFLRPEPLSGDRADLKDALYYTIDRLSETEGAPDAVLMLLPTNPFRTPGMLDRCIELLDGNLRVSSARPVDVNLGRCRATYGGAFQRLGYEDEVRRFYFPTGSFLGMAYVPPGCRIDENPEKFWAYFKRRFRDGYRANMVLQALRGAGDAIDIDTFEDLSRAEAFLGGETASAGLPASVLPRCVVGLTVVSGPHEHESMPVDLEKGVKYVLLARALRENGFLMGELGFHEIRRSGGGLECRPLFRSRKIETSYAGGRLRVRMDLPEGAVKQQIWIGAQPKADFCNLAQPFSLPPLWRFDAATRRRINLLTDAPIHGRQDCPAIHEEPKPAQAA